MTCCTAWKKVLIWPSFADSSRPSCCELYLGIQGGLMGEQPCVMADEEVWEIIPIRDAEMNFAAGPTGQLVRIGSTTREQRYVTANSGTQGRDKLASQVVSLAPMQEFDTAFRTPGDSVWRISHALNRCQGMMSLESFAYPGRYLCHSNNGVFCHHIDDGFHKDAALIREQMSWVMRAEHQVYTRNSHERRMCTVS
eukprot:TRINITY_DN21435_c0_g1_i1.p1 TRINITY_DN21435_c0_g1~~TRINITY_DN21435_c0_g1_i1.p1  ORF type:complete len:196 (+),score=27.47 TRINITY_DN21435_c0_g1_i1:87-674(+)